MWQVGLEVTEGDPNMLKIVREGRREYFFASSSPLPDRWLTAWDVRGGGGLSEEFGGCFVTWVLM